MLFNSFEFVVFFITILVVYYSLHRFYRLQNLILLAGSYVFYGFWDWRFLFLIAFSTVVDFLVGNALFKTKLHRRRKWLLTISVVANLTLLGFFKYFNFFAESFYQLVSLFGFHPDELTLSVILPVGISFYTFQTMSYTIDIYRNRLEPTRNFPDFALFVAFFPQLVAGPIERAVNLLPQITQPRKLRNDHLFAGIYLVIWGFFKKMVIADNMGLLADNIFNNYTGHTGFELALGVIAFAVQIYGDFSGYSDIARGIARLLGFELMINFKLPYFAVNPSDFWNRWHISLSSWLRDYLYIPLGGNRHGKWNTYRNLSLTMLLGGLWHGASWNFVLWGGFHGLILIIYRAAGFVRTPEIMKGWSLRATGLRWGSMLVMFLLTLFGWLIFRVRTMDQFVYFIESFSFELTGHSLDYMKTILAFSSPLIVMQVFQHIKKDLLTITRLPVSLLVLIYTILLISLFLFGVSESVEFIYFQF